MFGSGREVLDRAKMVEDPSEYVWSSYQINALGKESDLLDEIRLSLNKGMAIGYDRFKEDIEKLTGRRLRSKKVGRPVGWRKKRSGI